MTDRYTNAEWAKQIKETERVVMGEVDSGERAKKVYEGPRMRNGEEALQQLAKTVDHTVLKLDASGKTIDGLCSEARTEQFKVRLNFFSLFINFFCEIAILVCTFVFICYHAYVIGCI